MVNIQADPSSYDPVHRLLIPLPSPNPTGNRIYVRDREAARAAAIHLDNERVQRGATKDRIGALDHRSFVSFDVNLDDGWGIVAKQIVESADGSCLVGESRVLRAGDMIDRVDAGRNCDIGSCVADRFGSLSRAIRKHSVAHWQAGVHGCRQPARMRGIAFLATTRRESHRPRYLPRRQQEVSFAEHMKHEAHLGEFVQSRVRISRRCRPSALHVKSRSVHERNDD